MPLLRPNARTPRRPYPKQGGKNVFILRVSNRVNDGVLERVVRARGAESGVLRVVVLGISTLGMAATLPGQTAGVSLFIDAFIEDLGLSRSLVSWFYTVATVLSSLGLPLVANRRKTAISICS